MTIIILTNLKSLNQISCFPRCSDNDSMTGLLGDHRACRRTAFKAQFIVSQVLFQLRGNKLGHIALKCYQRQHNGRKLLFAGKKFITDLERREGGREGKNLA